MNNQVFATKDGLKLIVKSRKSAVIFELEDIQASKDYRFALKFTTKDFEELLHYIERVSSKSWTNLNPKEADSLGADYYEYYDRSLDNNGYLSITNNTLLINRPSLESEKLYQFNKKKMESFIYDYRNLIKS
ncbi:hypothetical protein [Siminovitchia fordii]|uniref:Uncharacterized protein n=1 Tax=Siminovitchia fordii TaxID=254759 RepID=A0ABQ4KC08_9BACI|nr:hypothetical protein [Siminovitchia fordii]GIN22566.1 hypothetical protein J1TS3_37000 [Siminovitchia fordii]